MAGGPTNPQGRFNPRLGQPAGIGTTWKRRAADPDLPLDPSGTLTVVATEAQVPDPNGLCFSHDYKRLYVASTGKGPGDTGPGGQGNVFVCDVNDDGTTVEPPAVHRLRGRRHQVRARRRALRRQRQRLDFQQRRPQRRLQRRNRLDARTPS